MSVEARRSGLNVGAEGGIPQDECWLVLSNVLPSSFGRVCGPVATRECCPVPSGAVEFVSFLLAVWTLDGDSAVQAGVTGFVDLTHASRAEGGLDLVGAERGAGLEGHWLMGWARGA